MRTDMWTISLVGSRDAAGGHWTGGLAERRAKEWRGADDGYGYGGAAIGQTDLVLDGMKWSQVC